MEVTVDTTPSTPTMDIMVEEVRVRNFRSHWDTRVKLTPLTLLVGANNAGKTSFLRAIGIALGGDRRFVSKEDLHIGADGSENDERWFEIDLKIVPIPGITFAGGWEEVFGQSRNFEGEKEFFAFRTRVTFDPHSAEPEVNRFFLRSWGVAREESNTKLTVDLRPLTYHFIDAKRDLLEDLGTTGSYWNRMVKQIQYSPVQLQAIETALTAINQQAVAGSNILQRLKDHLQELNQTLAGHGSGVEITPLPKRIRDLHKGLKVHFQDRGSDSFSLEYHGMGTRSWASLLAFKAFAILEKELSDADEIPYHSLLALEEPEAHLHPNAQRQLYQQIKEVHGQKIVSTHSAYVAAVTGLEEIRCFTKTGAYTTVGALNLANWDDEMKRKVSLEIFDSRGEILFSRFLVFYEGQTETMALPIFAEAYFGRKHYEIGITFVHVGGGKNYQPFLELANALGIDWYILSDYENTDIQAALHRALAGVQIDLGNNPSNVFCLNLDFENYLIQEGYDAEMRESWIEAEGPYNDPRGETAKRQEILNKSPQDLARYLKAWKTRLAPIYSRIITNLADESRRIPPKSRAIIWSNKVKAMIAAKESISLSDEQQKILDYWISHQGPVLVRASAGSGKTRLLTACVQRLLSVEKSKYRVLCLTYTVRAGEEMRQRLGKSEEVIARTFVGNLHEFAMNVFYHYYHEIGFSAMPHIIERRSDQVEMMTAVYQENASLKPYYQQPNSQKSIDEARADLIRNSLEFVSHAKQQLVFDPENTPNAEGWSDMKLLLFQDYNQRLRNQNLIDFDDILVMAWRIFAERPPVARIYRRLYPFILVDEAQDLNFAQYQLLIALCGGEHRNVMLVGDEKQSIYGFNGASNRYMLEEFPRDFGLPVEGTHFIRKNYRSSIAVIEAGNKIIPDAASAAASFFPGLAELRCFATAEDEAAWILSKLQALLDSEGNEEFSGKLSLEDVAVLARGRYVFDALQKLLQQQPEWKDRYYVRKTSDQLDSESSFMGVFELGARIVTNPAGALYQTQLKTKLGLQGVVTNGHRGIDFLAEVVALFPGNEELTQSELAQLIGAWEKIDNEKIDAGFALLEKAASEIQHDHERSLAMHDVAEWRESWRQYLKSVDASSISFAGFRRFVAYGMANTPPKDKLTLATVHAVKGLEYHVVFLIGMSQGTFPDYRSLQGAALEEERNNAYVAVTRAKRRLYISYPKSKMMPWGSTRTQQPSVFLSKFEAIEESAAFPPKDNTTP